MWVFSGVEPGYTVGVAVENELGTVKSRFVNRTRYPFMLLVRFVGTTITVSVKVLSDNVASAHLRTGTHVAFFTGIQ
jgi:hypothetical protein